MSSLIRHKYSELNFTYDESFNLSEIFNVNMTSSLHNLPARYLNVFVRSVSQHWEDDEVESTLLVMTGLKTEDVEQFIQCFD